MAGDSYQPTHKMAANAKRGLKLRDTFGRGGPKWAWRGRTNWLA
jgi:hypothetical protein